MARTARTKKASSNNRNNKKRKVGLKPKKENQKENQKQNPTPVNEVAPPTSDQIQRLLEPCTKDQLVNFLLDAASADPGLVARIRAVADGDVSHRKIFVHGLGWDTTRETVVESFEPFGEIEDCNVVIDKATGRAKGYGFVLFKSRSAALKALKEPQKTIKNRLTHSQLASVGPVSSAAVGPHVDADGRRVYVSNVHADAASDKLKAFFSRFGEIEVGPIGFDMNTGRSRGFALFIYKTREGATRAIEEPYKMFEGHQLHCQMATEKGKFPGSATDAITSASVPSMALLGAPQQQVLSAAQNLMLNPAAYAALLSQNQFLAAAALNPMAASVMNPMAASMMNPMAASVMNPAALAALNQGQGYIGAGMGGGASSVLGSYALQGNAGILGLQQYQGAQIGMQQYPGPQTGMQQFDGSHSGIQQYQGSQIGPSSSARLGNSFGSYPPYL